MTDTHKPPRLRLLTLPCNDKPVLVFDRVPSLEALDLVTTPSWAAGVIAFPTELEIEQ